MTRELQIFQAVATAREQIAAGAGFTEAVRDAAERHGADLVAVAWHVSKAEEGCRAARLLLGDRTTVQPKP